MGLIPAWVMRLWDAWDVRMLVLLSLSLQIILFIFGKRRKYISSQWISIVVWLAYLMADWVATVALSKLSDAQIVDRKNALRAIWAPLLLLHLGGPDTITAYQLEDNKLWNRHFMGLCAHVVAAVYVIVISWRNSGFYFLSFPVLVAGTIKYGERTWVLKSVCNDKWGEIVPLDILDTIELEEKFLYALSFARTLLDKLKSNMGTLEDIRFYGVACYVSIDDTYVWEGMEVEMGLMYDLYYTKAPKTYTKEGCILRSISFACMMPVLVGFFWLIFREVKWSHDQQHDYYSMVVDMAITGLLLVGALALEIYALVLLITSDWAMLWLIKQERKKLVIQLGQKLPWLFPMLRKKRWSKMMGQFDLPAFRVKKKKDVKNKTSMVLLSRRVLGLLGIQDKFDRYMHKTCVDVPHDLYSMISYYLRHLSVNNNNNPDAASAASECEEMFKFVEVDFMGSTGFNFQPFDVQIIALHFITEMFYTHDVLESNTNTSETIITNSSFEEESVDIRFSETSRTISETCRTISRYLIYLHMVYPSLLPLVAPNNVEMLEVTMIGLEGDVESHDVPNITDSRTGTDLAPPIIKYLKEKQAVERWRILKSKWLGMICYAVINVHSNHHLQQLSQGSEFLTLLWFFIAQCSTFEGLHPNRIFNKLSNQVKQRTMLDEEDDDDD